MWHNNLIQFARLLDEIAAVGLSEETTLALCESMDINRNQLNELFERAEQVWEKSKAIVTEYNRKLNELNQVNL